MKMFLSKASIVILIFIGIISISGTNVKADRNAIRDSDESSNSHFDQMINRLQMLFDEIERSHVENPTQPSSPSSYSQQLLKRLAVNRRPGLLRLRKND